MIELIKLNPDIKLDIRYARNDNFVGRPVYPEARAFLQKDAANALMRVHQEISNDGFGIVVFDGYRPWSITKLFWEIVREDQKIFVADPEVGSKHNRGCAVDLSMFRLDAGILCEMPSDFDEFNEKAFVNYSDCSETAKDNREFLIAAMQSEGFSVNPKEWWHFDYKDWDQYPILDLSFDSL